jgi:hypothetical protein
MSERAKRMRERAAEFARLANEARDPVIHAELVRLATLYEAQAKTIERGAELPSDPGETR